MILRLPCLGPEPMPLTQATSAVVGYARARRWLRFRSPGIPEGRWVEVPAFGWARFDARPASGGLDADILLAEGLHGRLDQAGWHAVHDTLAGIGGLVDALVAEAGGRPVLGAVRRGALGARRARHRRRVPAPDRAGLGRALRRTSWPPCTTGTPSSSRT